MTIRNLFLQVIGRHGSKLIMGAAILAGTSLTSSSFAQIVLDPGVNYAVGLRPDGVASADFDNDGDSDLGVVTNGGTGNLDLIEILLNNGDGTFAPGPIVFLPNTSSPGELIAADLDGDGDADMAVILRDFNQVQVVVNTGGAFSLGSTAAIGSDAQGLIADDYDSDFDMDMAVANRDSNTATILTNNGAGTFASLNVATGDEPRGVAFVNINGNLDIDLAVTNHRDRNVTLYNNTGAGFSPIGTLSVGGVYRPDGIVAADLNGNGFDDLAVAISDDVAPDAAMVFLNTGGTFGAGQMFFTNGLNSSGIIATDLDCDAAIDLVVSNSDSNNLSLLRNTGTGAFGAATTLATGVRPNRPVAADLDGDGDADVAVSNRDSNNVTVSINQSCVNVIATLNSIDVTVGTLTSGTVGDLVVNDDNVVQTRSGFGQTFVDLHNMTMQVSATSVTPSPSTVTVSIASRISETSGTAQIFLADWTNGGQPVQVGNYAINNTEATVTLNPQDAARFVRAGDGQILLTVKHIVFRPFLAFQFNSFIDQVEIVVE